jgi:oxygen-independent coproporphyrinogen-3 oxidase
MLRFIGVLVESLTPTLRRQMDSSSIAVYVHFPFCLSICPYCDFDRQATGFDRIDAYLAAVLRELDHYSDERVHSVFFGGGTPSLMSPTQLAGVLEAIAQRFQLLAGAEITVECNPGDADLEKLRAFRQAGATRLSFGVQSLDDDMLSLLGRRHSAAEATQAAHWARQAGFPFNLDFMFGLPGQTLGHWQHTLEQAIALAPDHLSCYLLTVDEKVPLGRDVARGRLVLPDDDRLAAMYDTTRSMLAAAGYEQYEVSNWAKPGQASQHNLTYWRDGAWIGVGTGAASAYGGRRWKNTPVLERYIASVERTGTAACVEDERPDEATQLMDFVTLGLRLREGIRLQVFGERFNTSLLSVLGDVGAWLIDAGVLELNGDRLRVAAERQMVLNEVLVRLAEPIGAYARRVVKTSQIAAR